MPISVVQIKDKDGNIVAQYQTTGSVRYNGVDLPIILGKDADYVRWIDIQKAWPENFEVFREWMSGQTCVLEGVYPSDLRRFIDKRPIID